ncbi:hypothetical protein C4573_02760 [Candidatus Woesearchaeota archaeon]|nr:MAG: hypothetical protein C4573_02760 [Candidatus Woesearchaeota archaeon]
MSLDYTLEHVERPFRPTPSYRSGRGLGDLVANAYTGLSHARQSFSDGFYIATDKIPYLLKPVNYAAKFFRDAVLFGVLPGAVQINLAHKRRDPINKYFYRSWTKGFAENMFDIYWSSKLATAPAAGIFGSLLHGFGAGYLLYTYWGMAELGARMAIHLATGKPVGLLVPNLLYRGYKGIKKTYNSIFNKHHSTYAPSWRTMQFA